MFDTSLYIYMCVKHFGAAITNILAPELFFKFLYTLYIKREKYRNQIH